MDVFQRRQMFKELADPNVSQETVEKWQRIMAGTPVEERYGDLERISKEESASGRRFELDVAGEQRTYWVPPESAWIGGGRITIDKAYRVFSEDETTMGARQVRSYHEIDAIKDAYVAEIRRVLGKE